MVIIIKRLGQPGQLNSSSRWRTCCFVDPCVFPETNSSQRPMGARLHRLLFEYKSVSLRRGFMCRRDFLHLHLSFPNFSFLWSTSWPEWDLRCPNTHIRGRASLEGFYEKWRWGVGKGVAERGRCSQKFQNKCTKSNDSLNLYFSAIL